MTLAGIATPGGSRAQAHFPQRPITLIVPFAPGGLADLTARAVARGMAPALGQPVVVENRPSAGSIVASQALATARPDGHTLLLMSNGNALASQRPPGSAVGERLHTIAGLADVAERRARRSFDGRKALQRASGRAAHRRFIMLYTVALVLLILWALGLATSVTAGGLLHLLLVFAVVVVIYQLITGRRAL